MTSATSSWQKYLSQSGSETARLYGISPERIVPWEADFNTDEVVDHTDLAEWQTFYGPAADADADDDGDSDGADFLVWQQQLGNSSSTSVAAATVPEPSGVLLVVLGGILAVANSRRCSRPTVGNGSSAMRWCSRPTGETGDTACSGETA